MDKKRCVNYINNTSNYFLLSCVTGVYAALVWHVWVNMYSVHCIDIVKLWLSFMFEVITVMLIRWSCCIVMIKQHRCILLNQQFKWLPHTVISRSLVSDRMQGYISGVAAQLFHHWKIILCCHFCGYEIHRAIIIGVLNQSFWWRWSSCIRCAAGLNFCGDEYFIHVIDIGDHQWVVIEVSLVSMPSRNPVNRHVKDDVPLHIFCVCLWIFTWRLTGNIQLMPTKMPGRVATCVLFSSLRSNNTILLYNICPSVCMFR